MMFRPAHASTQEDTDQCSTEAVLTVLGAAEREGGNPILSFCNHKLKCKCRLNPEKSLQNYSELWKQNPLIFVMVECNENFSFQSQCSGIKERKSEIISQSQNGFDVLQNIFPLTWVDEGADIDSDPDLLKEAKGFLVTPFVAVDAVMGVLIALGCVMIMGAIVNYVRIGRSSNNC